MAGREREKEKGIYRNIEAYYRSIRYIQRTIIYIYIIPNIYKN